MPCSFCREDCRDSGGRFASTASILCRKTPGGGTIARFSMQFARAARPGGNPGAPAAVLAAAGGSRRMSRVRGARVSCRPCSCGRQPGCAEAFLSASFVFPSLLSRFRRGSAPFQRESMGGASRARKSAVSGQQSAFWHGASPSWGAPERFHREPNSPTWAFPGRGHPPASREGGSRARARFRGQKSEIFAHGAALVRTARA